tara:strand:- start:211 stop:561 length:351 start_codon:yes stop_codon:yes gene_type:complete
MIETVKQKIEAETGIPISKIKLLEVGDGAETFKEDGTKTLYERDRLLHIFTVRLANLEEKKWNQDLIQSVKKFIEHLKETDKEEIFYYWSSEDISTYWSGWATLDKVLWINKKEKA